MHKNTRTLITLPLGTPLSEVVDYFDNEENGGVKFRSSWRDHDTGALVMMFEA